MKTLGIAPALGRDFAGEGNRFNGPRVGLLSFGLWRDAFGANPATVSQTIDLDEQPVRVIGILPAGFKMPQGADPDILLREQWDEHVARAPDSTIFLRAFARLKDGLSFEQARARLAGRFLSRSGAAAQKYRRRECVRPGRLHSAARIDGPALFELADRRPYAARAKRRDGGVPSCNVGIL